MSLFKLILIDSEETDWCICHGQSQTERGVQWETCTLL